MEKTIRCITLTGDYRDVPINQLEYRPTVYAFIVHEGKLLLFRSSLSKTWMLPGGKIELGETAIEALSRESIEEVGSDVERQEFFYADDQFYFHNEKQKGYQVYELYYRAQPILIDGKVMPKPGAETTELEWIPLSQVRPEEFHVTGMEAVRKFLQLYGHE
jgi:ADP-ribose pyrophosphatase YjhB (NUDIX family)